MSLKSTSPEPPAGGGDKSAGERKATVPRRDEPAAPQIAHRRVPIVPIVLLLLAAAGAGGYYWWQKQQAEEKDESRLVLFGNIDVRQVNLAFKVGGRIETLAVDEGDHVRAGAIIATLDKRYFNDDVEQARAERDNAAATLAKLEHGSRPEEIAEAQAQVSERRATLARTRQDYDRLERLVGQGATSRESFDLAKASLDESQARLAYAELALRLAEIGPRHEDIDAGKAQMAAADSTLVQAERRLEDSDLVAPSQGIILTRAREKGAIIAAGDTVFTLTLDSPVWVRTYVNERDLGRVYPDMPAEVRTDSAPGQVYKAKVGFISPTAEFTPKNVETRELRTDLVYRLRVVVDNPDNGLRQGMPVTVTLLLDDKHTAPPPGQAAAAAADRP